MKQILYLFLLLPLLYSCQKYNEPPFDKKEDALRKLPDTVSYMIIDSLWQKRDSLSYLRFKNTKQIVLIEADSIPKWITSFKNLKVLYSSNHVKKIKTIPKNIDLLFNLLQIDLPNNKISQLPKSIFNLKHLERLNLNDNSLNDIPNEIDRFTNLKVLLLGGNNLKAIPENTCKLNELSIFAFNDNPIVYLPYCFNSDSKIESFYISNTKITHIPIQILNLPNLKEIAAMGLNLDNSEEVKAICDKRRITFYYGK